MRRHSREDGGQTTVELALALPLLGLVAAGLVQVGLVVRDQVLVVHAAREAVRAAAVDASPEAARRAAEQGAVALDPTRLVVEVLHRDDPGGVVEVRVRYRSATDIPLAGPLMADAELTAHAVMRVER